MIVDLNFKIKTLEDKGWINLEPDGVNKDGLPKYKDSKPLTLRKVIGNSLSVINPDEKNLNPEEKAKRGWLAMKIYKHSQSTIDLDSDSVTLIKRLIGERYNNSLIIAQAWEILDPASKK